MTTALLKKLRVKVICGASSNRRWRSARSLTSTSSVMSSWRSGRGLQWQPVKLWWTPCSRGLRQCWKIMVATQNIDTLGPIWTFSLRGVLTFVASGLDINGCVLSYFEGIANLHCYTSCIQHIHTVYDHNNNVCQVSCHLRRFQRLNECFLKGILWCNFLFSFSLVCHVAVCACIRSAELVSVTTVVLMQPYQGAAVCFCAKAKHLYLAFQN